MALFIAFNLPFMPLIKTKTTAKQFINRRYYLTSFCLLVLLISSAQLGFLSTWQGCRSTKYGYSHLHLGSRYPKKRSNGFWECSPHPKQGSQNFGQRFQNLCQYSPYLKQGCRNLGECSPNMQQGSYICRQYSQQLRQRCHKYAEGHLNYKHTYLDIQQPYPHNKPAEKNIRRGKKIRLTPCRILCASLLIF